MAHSAGALVVVDGAQLVPHAPIKVTELGADFLAFSAHKMMGPTGIGVLWARKELLNAMPPFLGGGGMILDVKLDSFRPAPPPGSRLARHPSPRPSGSRPPSNISTRSAWTAFGPTSSP